MSEQQLAIVRMPALMSITRRFEYRCRPYEQYIHIFVAVKAVDNARKIKSVRSITKFARVLHIDEIARRKYYHHRI